MCYQVTDENVGKFLDKVKLGSKLPWVILVRIQPYSQNLNKYRPPSMNGVSYYCRSAVMNNSVDRLQQCAPRPLNGVSSKEKVISGQFREELYGDSQLECNM